MTEVETAMPEGVPLPSPTAVPQTLSSSSNAAEDTSTIVDSSNDAQQLKEQQNSNGKPPIVANKPVALEVDGIDTEEEEDSQITSSTENGDVGDICKMSVDDVSKPTAPVSIAEDSKDEEAVVVMPEKVTTPLDEDSANACDGVVAQNCSSPLNDNKSVTGEESQSQNSVSSLKQPTTVDTDDDDDEEENESTSSSESLQKQNVVSSSVQEGESKSQGKLSNNVDEPSMDTNDAKSNDHENVITTGGSVDPLRTNTPERNSIAKQKTLESTAKDQSKTSDGSVVDLDDDDSDEEEHISINKKCEQSTSKDSSVKPRTTAGTESPCNKAKPSCSTDSDGAVVIGSDSENESSSPTKAKSATATTVVEQQVVTDDDDDCIMIEDDAPPTGSNCNESMKRKNPILDSSTNNSDDSLPPSKRQCSIAPVIPTTTKQPMNQLIIKDARTLLPQDVPSPKRSAEGSVYPINIASAITPSIPQQGPPKLVPMGSGLGNMQTLNSGMSGMGASNANLLPGLTDDMFVLEAPSFIVPYIYEKPPVAILKDVIKELEAKHKLTKEDLAEADKSDEFDMMTEQNKTEREEKGEKRKKKRRGGDDADDSWSEDSEEDDEDEDEEDSDAGIRTKVLIKEASDDLTAIKGVIKPAAAVTQPVGMPAAAAPKPGQENYFESPLGKFFMDIGVGLVQEFVQSDLIRLQKRKMRKSLGKNITEFERAISALSGNLEASRKKNSAFKFNMKRCEFCNFKSESALAMAHHYETPHMNGPLYKCNFCTFEIRNATEIVYHMEAMHNIKARLIKPLPYHQCPNCGFEDNGKAKLARHQPVCAKKFRPEMNLAPPNDWEAPAKIPRIKPRHGLVGTATAYQAMAAQAAAQKAALASIQQQQAQVAQARSIQAAALAAQNAAVAKNVRGRPPILSKSQPAPMMRGVPPHHPIRTPMGTNLVLSNSYQMAAAGSQQQQQQLLQQQQHQAANALAKKTLTGQPSISITPLPRQSAAPPQAPLPSTSKMPPTGMKPGQSPNSTGNKAQFVICEICDGYIKDLEQLRNHMQWMHKVKIHPKMIYNRPPLNCQKCQFRFFTDQGLERHLLGSHGLVTSSMQEAANKGKDAGRCPVCGRMYQWKLLNHVSRDHHMTLKQAHLSYKCTVCTATFGMYKQFETHVYTAHSTVAKKAIDNKKNNASPNLAASSSTTTQRGSNSVSAANESLLKPLKINDEITIIPQPANKPRITNMESHVID